ncbi:hypothetical protein AB4189_26455, partial [Vibrio sp. 10N.286.49.E1]|uniref:hypothetical protein n=1 Tax=Vibrio sp. 10N.286.49.E1 TaxID=3229702 RepID=UPI003552BD66
PVTAAQTWENKNPKVDLNGKGKIRGATSGRYIGYKNNNKIDGNHSNACDSGTCLVDDDLRLEEEPDFNAPNGAIGINLKDKSGTLNGGIYEASGEVLLTSGNTLT